MMESREGELWRSIPIDGFRERYEVSDLGRIRNVQLLKVRLPTIATTGYKALKLHINGKERHFKVHQLVALAFITRPVTSEILLVNHINGDKLDNRAINLEWVTKSANAIHAHTVLRYRRRKGSFYSPLPEELKNEMWLALKHPKFPTLGSLYEISNLGRIRRLTASRGSSVCKLISNFELGGYIGVTLTPTSARAKTFHLHVLVAWAFLRDTGGDNQAFVVDHIDENSLNPRANNLRWATIRQNALYGYGKLTQNQVEEIQNEYAVGRVSQMELAKRYSVSQQQVSKILRGRQREGVVIAQDLRSAVTATQVNEIRLLGAAGNLTIKSIAERFSISPAQVANILSGRAWGHLPYRDGLPWTPIARKEIRSTKVPKVSKEVRDAIKLAYIPGKIAQAELSKRFGVERSVISRIVSTTRRTFKA